MGAQGSGTTLMRLILDSHPDVAMAQETGFARLLLANEHIPYAQHGSEWYGRLGLSRSDLDRELGSFYGGIFGRWAAARGASRWGDKTPFHVWHIERLARVFPDAVFLGMVRHPGAAASSRHRRMGHSWSGSLTHWTKRNKEMLHQGAALGTRFLLCRYENLVTDPEEVLRDLTGRLGLPWDDRLLAFHQVHRESGTPTQVEGYTLSDEPLDPKRISAWTRELQAEHWALLERRRVRQLTRFLGYTPRDALPPPGWGPHHPAPVLDGDALSARMARRSSIDWTARPEPPFADRPLRRQDLRRFRSAGEGGGAAPSPAEIGQTGRRAASRLMRVLPPARRRTLRSAWWTFRRKVRRGSRI